VTGDNSDPDATAPPAETGVRAETVPAGEVRAAARASAIATGRGDDGTTGLLYGGDRIPKDDLRAEAYGTLDETVAALGLARAELDMRRRLDLLPPGLAELEAVVLRNVKDETRVTLPIEGLFVSIGMDPITGFIKGLLELNEWGEIVVDPTMATSQPGIYAAGDVIDACPHQVASAVGSGVHAAISVDEYLSK